jgi:hypothetical protein
MDWNDIIKTCKINKNCADVCKKNRNTICKYQLDKIFESGVKRRDNKSYCDVFFDELGKLKSSVYQKVPEKIDFLKVTNKYFSDILLNDIHPGLLVFIFVHLRNCKIVEYLITEFSHCKKISLRDISNERFFNNINDILPSVSLSYRKVSPFYFALLNCDLEMMDLLYTNNCTSFKPREYNLILRSFNNKHECKSEDAHDTRRLISNLKDHMSMKGGVIRTPNPNKIRYRPY